MRRKAGYPGYCLGRNSAVHHKNSTTKNIGKAFDDAFPGGTWAAATTGMGIGEMLAEFHSTTTAEAL